MLLVIKIISIILTPHTQFLQLQEAKVFKFPIHPKMPFPAHTRVTVYLFFTSTKLCKTDKLICYGIQLLNQCCINFRGSVMLSGKRMVVIGEEVRMAFTGGTEKKIKKISVQTTDSPADIQQSCVITKLNLPKTDRIRNLITMSK